MSCPSFSCHARLSIPTGAPRPETPTVPMKDGAFDFARLTKLVAALEKKTGAVPRVAFSAEQGMDLGTFLETVEKAKAEGGEGLFPEVFVFGGRAEKK